MRASHEATLRRRVIGGVLGLSWLAVLPAEGQIPTVPAGGEFQVNTLTADAQVEPDSSPLPAGGFVVVWRSTSNLPEVADSIEGQRLASDGSLLGEQFQINSSMTAGIERREPSVASDALGNFVVAWVRGGYPDRELLARRFDPDGSPQDEPFQVATGVGLFDTELAMRSDGEFVAVWRGDGLQARRFSSLGEPLGDPFAVSLQGFAVSDPSVAYLSDDGFAVVWQSTGSVGDDDSEASVQGVRFDSVGSRIGGEFQVNAYTTGWQVNPAVAAGIGGEFVVSWTGSTEEPDNLRFRRFASDGQALEGDFEVVSFYSEFGYSVETDPDGDFVVTWTRSDVPSYRVDPEGLDSDAIAHRFRSDGSPVGEPFRVNTFFGGFQLEPSLVMAPSGDFVVVWESSGSQGTDTSSHSIQAQRYRVTADIGDRVWLDENANGIQDPGEPGVPDVLIRLKDGSSQLLASTRTDNDGHFLFRPKIALEGVIDEFYLKFVAPRAMAFTTQDVGGEDREHVDSDADPLTGKTAVFEIESAGEIHLDIDAGLVDDSAIFADGFESGDVTGWSSSTGD